MRFKLITYHLSLITLLFSTLSCHNSPVCDCIDSTGPASSEIRDVPYFNQLYVEDNINVFVSTGSPEQVTIQGGANLITNISAGVSNNVLTLKNHNSCNWLRSYKKSAINVYITMPALTTITNAGFGKVQSQGTLTFDSLALYTINSSGDIQLNVNSNFINAHLFGTADLTLSGYAKTFTTNFFGGTGFIYNNSLETKYTFVSSSTTGDCYVSADSAMTVEIFGEGNVYYSGNITPGYFNGGGTGQLIKN